jgi:hypothetical protein
MKTQRMKECLAAPGVHELTKDILRMAEDKDCVDAYYDVLLAAELLKERMDEILETHDVITMTKDGRP